MKYLDRTTFKTSRLLDFASERELAAQTGHGIDEWPLVVAKELLDNALDGCEEAGIAPEIAVEVDESGITVRDNGPGIPASTVTSVLDFTTRTSSREAYVSPTRGQQGNALKTILAMPFVLDGKSGCIEIAAQGVRHRITFKINQIRQEPVIEHDVQPDETCKNGTEIRVHWPEAASSILEDAEAGFLQIARDFVWLNPHLTLDVMWFGGRSTAEATDPSWRKWTPRDPTSPHWYTLERFTRLIGATVADDHDKGRSRSVREFVSTFRGLSGTAKGKSVLSAVGLSREPLDCLVADDLVDAKLAGRLLQAMRDHSAPVKPTALGTIGREHFEARFADLDCEMELFQYRKLAGYDLNGIPCVIEAAFVWRGKDFEDEEGQEEDEENEDGTDEENEDGGFEEDKIDCEIDRETRRRIHRRLICAVNWSATIRNPLRSVGPFGTSLDSILTAQKAAQDEPVIVVIHLAYPVATHLDRGKGSVTGAITKTSSIPKLVEDVTKKWANQRKSEERDVRRRQNRRNAMTRTRGVSIREAAFEVMAQAYLKASANGTLPAHARQIMYAARPHIQALATRDLSATFDSYFSQTLLPDYVEERGVDWNVVYDSRGHFHEPHTNREVPLGTLDVRKYLNEVKHDARHAAPDPISFSLSQGSFPTVGPRHRYNAILFVEKEGFMPLFNEVLLAERFDIAVMSTKGMSVTASRQLVESICGAHGIPLLLLHDFDKSGLSIAATLQRDTRRYKFSKTFAVHDLGLRMADIAGLETERVTHNASDDAVAANLAENGATAEEIDFLLNERVEINAFASDELVAFIEGKLAAIGIQKVVPDEVTLKAACARARAKALINKEIGALIKKASQQAKEMPDVPDLADRVREIFASAPAMPWDEAVALIVQRTEGEPS